MKKLAYILSTFMVAGSLSAFTGCSLTGGKPVSIEQASETVTMYALIKHYDRDALTARQLMKGYPDAKPEVNQWLEDLLTTKSLLESPKIDIIEKLRAKHTSYDNLKEHVRVNWDKVKDEDKPFVVAFEGKMDILFKVLGEADEKINSSKRGKLIMDYLTTVNQLNAALSGKLL